MSTCDAVQARSGRLEEPEEMVTACAVAVMIAEKAGQVAIEGTAGFVDQAQDTASMETAWQASQVSAAGPVKRAHSMEEAMWEWSWKEAVREARLSYPEIAERDGRISDPTCRWTRFAPLGRSPPHRRPSCSGLSRPRGTLQHYD